MLSIQLFAQIHSQVFTQGSFGFLCFVFFTNLLAAKLHKQQKSAAQTVSHNYVKHFLQCKGTTVIKKKSYLIFVPVCSS